jgi:replication fork clamp-binding protein CrfC
LVSNVLNLIEQAADYVRLGKNSAVLKKVEYYCNHDLLKDGNVIVDTPGIDAPVERDAKVANEFNAISSVLDRGLDL